MRRSQSQTFKSARAITNSDAKKSREAIRLEECGRTKASNGLMPIEILVIIPLGRLHRCDTGTADFD